MFLLALCLIGTAMAAPAIPEAPALPAETHVLVSPYLAMYPAPLAPLRTLDIMIEPEPKEENAELPEPKEESPEEPLAAPEELPAPEEPKLEPKPAEPIVIKLDIPKPPSFISDWFSSLPFQLPNISLPPFLTNWFPSSSNPPKLMYPAYYPGTVYVGAPKP